MNVSDGEIWFNWTDGTEDHEPIDFTLLVVAIDRAGNESAPQMVRVHDDPGGCAIARPRRPYRGLTFVAAAALLLAARRRKTPRGSTGSRAGSALGGCRPGRRSSFMRVFF